MINIFKIIAFPFKWMVLGLIKLYKVTISKMSPSCCRYTPSCSTYMYVAIQRFGLFKGIILGTKRIFRCTPKYECGLDPVPDNIKTNIKYFVWLFAKKDYKKTKNFVINSM